MERSFKLFLSCVTLLCTTTLSAQENKSLADSAVKFFSVRSNIAYTSPQWQTYIDSALRIDSTVGKLWQWKGMPYFKNGDYAEAFRCYEKAVLYDPVNYMPLRAFMKATFLKDYEAAIEEFLICKDKHYGVALMDHSYDFFLGLCYKETGDLANAERYMSASIDEQTKSKGENWVHWNEWFFMGMIKYEKQAYKDAIKYYDKCLKEYRGYPNALYHKALALARLNKKDEARVLFQQAMENMNKGMKSSEDNDYYVNYPNQVFVADIEATMQELYP